MKFEEAIEWIEECNKLGSVLGLDNMENLMNAFQYPDEKLNIIHVAGTNGKGSVSTFISEIGKVHGLKVGRYISPTIFCYQERFQINNRNISKEKLVIIICHNHDLVEKYADYKIILKDGKQITKHETIKLDDSFTKIKYKKNRDDKWIIKSAFKRIKRNKTKNILVMASLLFSFSFFYFQSHFKN